MYILHNTSILYIYMYICYGVHRMYTHILYISYMLSYKV